MAKKRKSRVGVDIASWKGGRKKRFETRLPAELKERAMAHAKEQGKTLADLVNELLEQVCGKAKK